MLLLLCRHALAADRDDQEFPDDTLRPLVSRGRQEQRRMGRRLARRGIVPTVIFASPWKRAWQTAGILGRETGTGKKRRVSCDSLATEPNLAALAKAIGPRSDEDVIALVGHEPWMSELASLLLTGSPTRLAIEFQKSGVMGIQATEVGPASGLLRFFLT